MTEAGAVFDQLCPQLLCRQLVEPISVFAYVHNKERRRTNRLAFEKQHLILPLRNDLYPYVRHFFAVTNTWAKQLLERVICLSSRLQLVVSWLSCGLGWEGILRQRAQVDMAAHLMGTGGDGEGRKRSLWKWISHRHLTHKPGDTGSDPPLLILSAESHGVHLQSQHWERRPEAPWGLLAVQSAELRSSRFNGRFCFKK